MANTREFMVERLMLGEVAIGGLQAFNANPDFVNEVLSTPDGALGVEEIDLTGLAMPFSFTSTDVGKFAAIMADTGGALTLGGRESGAATYRTHTIAGAVFTNLAMNFLRNGDASMTVGGQIRFIAGTDLETIMVAAKAVVAGLASGPYGEAVGTQTFPTRYYKPNNASFTETGGSPIAPAHVESLNLSIAAKVIRDNSDDDVGFSAVDVTGWNEMLVSAMFRDGTAAASKLIATNLLAAASGALTVDLTGRSGGDADAATLTINALKWKGYPESLSEGYTTYNMSGKAGWRISTGQALSWDGVAATGIMAIVAK
jgi:hypothetical protein